MREEEQRRAGLVFRLRQHKKRTDEEEISSSSKIYYNEGHGTNSLIRAGHYIACTSSSALYDVIAGAQLVMRSVPAIVMNDSLMMKGYIVYIYCVCIRNHRLGFPLFDSYHLRRFRETTDRIDGRMSKAARREKKKSLGPVTSVCLLFLFEILFQSLLLLLGVPHTAVRQRWRILFISQSFITTALHVFSLFRLLLQFHRRESPRIIPSAHFLFNLSSPNIILNKG